jgi:hypothetical protein
VASATITAAMAEFAVLAGAHPSFSAAADLDAVTFAETFAATEGSAKAASAQVTATAASPAEGSLAAAATTQAADASVAAATARDRRRTWIWAFLGALVASQLYFVKELLVAFVMFTLVFAAVAAVVIALYMLPSVWEVAMVRMAAVRRPVLQISPVPHDTHKPA